MKRICRGDGGSDLTTTLVVLVRHRFAKRFDFRKGEPLRHKATELSHLLGFCDCAFAMQLIQLGMLVDGGLVAFENEVARALGPSASASMAARRQKGWGWRSMQDSIMVISDPCTDPLRDNG